MGVINKFMDKANIGCKVVLINNKKYPEYKEETRILKGSYFALPITNDKWELDSVNLDNDESSVSLNMKKVLINKDTTITLEWRKLEPATNFEIRTYFVTEKNGWETIEKEKLAITRYRGHNKYVGIPPVIHGMNVSKLDPSLFKDSDIEAVSLPWCCESIGKSCFENCANLKAVMIPSDVLLTHVGERAFADCSKLWSLSFGGKIQDIARDAFEGCDKDMLDLWIDDRDYVSHYDDFEYFRFRGVDEVFYGFDSSEYRKNIDKYWY